MELHTSRVCLTLLESSTDPADWAKDDKDCITYYEPLLVSHGQHVQISQAYFDYIERTEAAGKGAAAAKRSSTASTGSTPVEASALKAELERLQQQQQREEEITQLQRELDEITEEAHKRIEKGAEAIVKLKQLLDMEAVQLQREHVEAEQRVQVLRQEGASLRQRVEFSKDASAATDTELQKLRQDVLVLTNQKDALMKMVQDIYGTAQSSPAGAEQSPAQAAAARALASIQGPSLQGAQECRVEEKLLPDAHELLNEPLRPL